MGWSVQILKPVLSGEVGTKRWVRPGEPKHSEAPEPQPLGHSGNQQGSARHTGVLHC